MVAVYPVGGSAGQFGNYVKTEVAKFTRLAKQGNLDFACERYCMVPLTFVSPNRDQVITMA